MSRICQVSGRGSLSGNRRSHSNRATRRKQKVNLQKVTYKGKKIKVSARTLKVLTKQGKL